MSTNMLWYSNRQRIIYQQKPVLDQNRNKIITYDKIFQQNNLIYPSNEDFAKLRDNGYQIEGEIGRGGYGIVYKAKSLKDDSKIFAIKKNFDVVARSTIYLQVAFFHLVRKKRNLPKMVDLFFAGQTPYVVLQYFQHQPYQIIFNSFTTLTEVKHYMIELLKGIYTLKNLGIYHRDIKPHNFLFNTKQNKGILIDFGLAEIDADYVEGVIQKRYYQAYKNVPKKQRQTNQDLINKKNEWNLYKKILKANQDHGFAKIGTQSYVCLQTLLGSRDQGHECQIWSAGVILMQFLTQKIHFFNQPKITKKQNTQNIRYISIFIMELTQMFGVKAVEQHLRRINWTVVFPKNMPQKGDLKKMMVLKSDKQQQNEQAFDLMMKMLALIPQQRITVQDAIWHPFFDEVRQQHYQSNSQKKWIKEQYEKRNNKQQNTQREAQQMKQQIMNENQLQKSFSVNPCQSQYSKSASKMKKEDSQNSFQQNQSENQQSSGYIRKHKQKKEQQIQRNQNQTQKSKSRSKSDDHDKQLDKQEQKQNILSEQQKQQQQQRKQYSKQNNDKQSKNKQKDKDKQTSSKQTTKETGTIMQQIKKYVQEKQTTTKINIKQRITVDDGYQQPRSKVQKKVVAKFNKRTVKNLQETVKKQQKQVKQILTIKINSTLQEILKKQEQRLQNQRKSGPSLQKIFLKDLPNKVKQNKSSPSYSDDQS